MLKSQTSSTARNTRSKGLNAQATAAEVPPKTVRRSTVKSSDVPVGPPVDVALGPPKAAQRLSTRLHTVPIVSTITVDGSDSEGNEAEPAEAEDGNPESSENGEEADTEEEEEERQVQAAREQEDQERLKRRELKRQVVQHEHLELSQVNQATLTGSIGAVDMTPTSKKRPAAIFGEESDVLTAHQNLKKRRKDGHHVNPSGSSRKIVLKNYSPGSDTETVATVPNTPNRATGIPADGKNPTRLGAYSTRSQHVFNFAKHYYKMAISIHNLYPSAIEQQEFSSAAFDRANTGSGNTVQLTAAIATMITDIGPAFRGTIKTHALATIKSLYCLSTLVGDPLKIRINSLLQNENFIYHRIKPRPEGQGSGLPKRIGPFEHPCIFEVIALGWFDGRYSLANTDKTFRSVPANLIAFVCCVVACALQHWSTGLYIGIDFTQREFNPLYHKIKALLADYQHNVKDKYVEMLRKHNEAAFLRGGVGAAARNTVDYDSDSSLEQFRRDESPLI